MTCPLESDDTIKWEKNDVVLTDESDKHLVLEDFSETKDSGYYVCYSDEKQKNKFLYLKARGNSGSSQNSFVKNQPPKPATVPIT